MEAMAKTYEFEAQLTIGQKYEAELDAYYINFYDIFDVPLALQKLSIDRIFQRKRHPKRRISVEYKTDIKAADTGYFFIEILSNSRTGAAGWAHSSISQQLVFYVPKYKRAGVVSTDILKSKLYEWERDYRTVECQNKDYYSKGILVPWDVLRELMFRKFDVVPNPGKSSRGTPIRIAD